ncbi:MAG TPA: deoxyribodipyrimidine photo-lyase [Xanthomonadales bacterium]|nr:deoxyribodipyrimidine photo-lyase [Xanthomonadales bacterium]
MPSPRRHAAIVWFRRDLRLADNPALAAALATGLPVVPLWVHAPEEEAPWHPGAASRWWLHRSLGALAASLAERGAPLVVRRGPSRAAIESLCDETGARHVFWNRRHEPALAARDAAVEQALRDRGIDTTTSESGLLFGPREIATAGGAPYRVFTPFWRNARARLRVAPPTPAPARIPAVPGLRSVAIDELGLAPRIAWDTGLADAWLPGEAGAQAALEAFLAHAHARYAAERDLPAVDGTSRLSPHLHFGEIGPRQVVAALARHAPLERSEKFLAELGWREFAHHLLAHFPHTTEAPFDPRFERFPWQSPDPALLQAWRRGRTGYPLVDAGMRQLWATGWMHNRVRMVVASFLTKNLRVHWLEGARWFWDTLVDADLANNTQGWQWTAGSGADPAPYFRIFNPVAQGERFDPSGAYVRRWIPELAHVPASHVHRPWTLPAAERARHGLAGTPYESPIVDLAGTRAAALAAHASMRAAWSGAPSERVLAAVRAGA